MRKKLVGLVLGAMFACSANAATWYALTNVGGQNSYYFFDAETIVKQPGTVSIWLKNVDSEKTVKDGVYSAANKFVFDCKKRTIQLMVSVRYGKTQEHLRTNNTPGTPSDVVPGTTGETMLKTICASSFPEAKTDTYFKVTDNDIYGIANRYFESVNDPAPK